MTLQLPELRVQDALLLNTSLATLELNAIVPSGVEDVPAAAESETVTVTVLPSPTTTEIGLSATDVDVERVFTVRVAAFDVAEPHPLVTTTSYKPALATTTEEIV